MQRPPCSTAGTISTFALDKYEVTVGRYKQFVDAYAGRPAGGAGAHPLIPGSGWQVSTSSCSDLLVETAFSAMSADERRVALEGVRLVLE